jgi:hypothetical protein
MGTTEVPCQCSLIPCHHRGSTRQVSLSQDVGDLLQLTLLARLIPIIDRFVGAEGMGFTR